MAELCGFAVGRSVPDEPRYSPLINGLRAGDLDGPATGRHPGGNLPAPISALAVKYAESLMRKNYEAVGFLPRPRLEKYADAGQLWLQFDNGEPCGYLIFGNGWPVLRVYQCCIAIDARRRDHAGAMIGRLIDLGRSRGCSQISLWCADDLDSNGFWRALGFSMIGQRDNGNQRGRKHNCWAIWLLSLFAGGSATARQSERNLPAQEAWE